MDNNRPHSRDKRVGEGSVTARKGQQINSGGPVGGGSQNGRPRPMPGGSQRYGGQAPFGGVPRRARARRATGGISLSTILLLALFLFFRGCGSDNVQSMPAATPRPTAYVTHTQAPAYTQQDDGLQTIDDTGLFSSQPGSQTTPPGSLYGYGESYSGTNPTGTSDAAGGGLLQDLPGTVSAPKPTSTPKPTAAPGPTAAPAAADARARFFTPLGGGRDDVTVMIYMCGTDLESKYGMATSDLSEMTKARLSDKVNVIVETGGARTWKNNVVSSSVNQVYRVQSGGLERLEKNFGSAAMTDPGNLTKFIQYCAKNYPANRNILILWDHGGGSISGYGYDEKTGGRSSMTLPQISQALENAEVNFDWIGYDACLMSTLETALVSANHADYLIASEEVEPGTGWYYTDWLNALSRNTSVSTETLGKTIIDSYVSACRQKSGSAQVTLAMTDLVELESKLPAVFRDFSVSTNEMIEGNDYRQVSNARAGARQFAQSTRINQVDLADLALRIGSEEGKALARTIQDCVKYNGTTITKCYGLSIYFPYESMSSVSSAVNTYDVLGLDEEYAKVIKSFASVEYGGQLGGSASQSYDGWDSLFGTGGYGDLLESLFGSSAYAGSSAYGGSPYGSTSPLGSLSGSYTNGYGQSSAGYSVDLGDLVGLFSAFSGRSMPADLSWVDTKLIASSARQMAGDFLDPGRIAVSYKNGRPVLELTDEEWAKVQTVELNIFADDGEGYIDLGLDNVFEFDGDALVLEHDGTVLTLNGQLVAYYLVSDTLNPDGTWTSIGRIPALLNGELVNLQVVFDDENPYGTVTGAYPFYEKGETETAPKGLIPIQYGDKLVFVCDYYGYDGSYQSSHLLDSGFTVTSPLVLSNTYLTNQCAPSYRITDLFGNHYWLAF